MNNVNEKNPIAGVLLDIRLGNLLCRKKNHSKRSSPKIKVKFLYAVIHTNLAYLN